MISDSMARQIIADGAHACRELAAAWTYDEERCRRDGRLYDEHMVANRRAWALQTAHELSIMSTDIALSFRLIQIKAELQMLAGRITQDQVLDIGGDPVELEADALLQLHRRPEIGTVREIGAAETSPSRRRPRPRRTPHVAGRRAIEAG